MRAPCDVDNKESELERERGDCGDADLEAVWVNLVQFGNGYFYLYSIQRQFEGGIARLQQWLGAG